MSNIQVIEEEIIPVNKVYIIDSKERLGGSEIYDATYSMDFGLSSEEIIYSIESIDFRNDNPTIPAGSTMSYSCDVAAAEYNFTYDANYSDPSEVAILLDSVLELNWGIFTVSYNTEEPYSIILTILNNSAYEVTLTIPYELSILTGLPMVSVIPPYETIDTGVLKYINDVIQFRSNIAPTTFYASGKKQGYSAIGETKVSLPNQNPIFSGIQVKSSEMTNLIVQITDRWGQLMKIRSDYLIKFSISIYVPQTSVELPLPFWMNNLRKLKPDIQKFTKKELKTIATDYPAFHSKAERMTRRANIQEELEVHTAVALANDLDDYVVDIESSNLPSAPSDEELDNEEERVDNVDKLMGTLIKNNYAEMAERVQSPEMVEAIEDVHESFRSGEEMPELESFVSRLRDNLTRFGDRFITMTAEQKYNANADLIANETQASLREYVTRSLQHPNVGTPGSLEDGKYVFRSESGIPGITFEIVKEGGGNRSPKWTTTDTANFKRHLDSIAYKFIAHNPTLRQRYLFETGKITNEEAVNMPEGTFNLILSNPASVTDWTSIETRPVYPTPDELNTIHIAEKYRPIFVSPISGYSDEESEEIHRDRLIQEYAANYGVDDPRYLALETRPIIVTEKATDVANAVVDTTVEEHLRGDEQIPLDKPESE